jgi:solute:Na+ symporter, SSS family
MSANSGANRVIAAGHTSEPGRRFGALQVAGLLVSASYGIGFLFGSGEMAAAHGMAGSLYGLATAAGMLLLALLAPRLWAAGVPIWALFGRGYGAPLSNSVALLSVVWMAGVLAAQIHGGAVVFQMLGMPEWVALGTVLAAIYGASRLDLGAASRLLPILLAAASAILVWVLVADGGGTVYAQTPSRLAVDAAQLGPVAVGALVLGVVALVVTGADYHQFVLAASRPRTAVQGCIAAAAFLALLSPLPAAVVIAMGEAGHLAGLADAKQVIPQAIAGAASRLAQGVDKVMLLVLSFAALGSGAAILRAMTDALGAVAVTRQTPRVQHRALIALAAGGLLALRDQGIVQTMVSINLVYIGSVSVLFAATLLGRWASPRRALASVVLGFVASFTTYLAVWHWAAGAVGELMVVGAGIVASALAWWVVLPDALRARPLSLPGSALPPR